MPRKEPLTIDTPETVVAIDGTQASEAEVNSPEIPTSANFKKPISHVLASSDGGTGKSTTARMLCARYEKQAIAYKLVDTDPKMDVCNSYAPELYRRWTGTVDYLDAGNDGDDCLKTQIQLYDTKVTVGGESLGDRLLMLACASNTIINLPGNSLQALHSWIDNNFLSSRKLPFDLVFWWVSSGRQGDQEAFAKFAGQYPEFKHCIVFNEYHANEWARFQPIKPVTDLINKGTAKTVRLLPQRNRDNVQIIESGKTFQELISSMHPFMGETLNNWLDMNLKNLEETGLLI
jgi:hypothetical protein